MAAQTCAVAQTATLSTTVADSITFSSTGTSLCVTNHDASNKLYFRVDGVTAVGAADDNYVVLPSQSVTINRVGISGWDGVGAFPVISVVGSGNIYTVAIA